MSGSFDFADVCVIVCFHFILSYLSQVSNAEIHIMAVYEMSMKLYKIDDYIFVVLPYITDLYLY